MPDQGRPSLHWLSRLLPRSIGGQCMFGLLLGILASLLLGPRVARLTPLGQIFLRASQIAVMPYLICELVGSLGSLQPASMRLLSRTGGLVLLAILASGALTVLLLPASLPALTSSAFFSPELLQPPEPPDLVSTYLPFNIFSALADDNFPAVVLFAAVLGVLVQGLPRTTEFLVKLIPPIGVATRACNARASWSSTTPRASGPSWRTCSSCAASTSTRPRTGAARSRCSKAALRPTSCCST